MSDIASGIQIPGHRILEVIREVPDDRRVLRTFAAGRNCVTRLLLSERLDPSLSPLLQQVVLQGTGLGSFPASLDTTLAGYRAVARLSRRPDDPWTFAVAAGVTPEGWAWISTRWIDGNPLNTVLHLLTPRQRLDVAREVAHILVRLHESQIAYGDLKAENLIHVSRDRDIAAGRVALIDLDTSRIVPGPTDYSPTRALTHSWAAPEQKQGRTCLSSDLWAFGMLLDRLAPEGLPPNWGDLIAALRQTDPLCRPQTTLVWRRLCDQPGPLLDWCGRPTPRLLAPEPTVRLPEPATPVHPSLLEGDEDHMTVPVDPDPPLAPPAPTARAASPPILPFPDHVWKPTPEPVKPPPEPVKPPPEPSKPDAGMAFVLRPEAPGPPPGSPPGPPPDPRRPEPPSMLSRVFSGCMLAPLAATGALIFACAGGLFWWDQQKVVEANLLAEATVAGMKAYKTQELLNSDKTQRTRLREMAEESWAVRHTARSGAVRALAIVWEQGWQDSNRKWSAERYEEGMRAVEESPGANEPEALLAKASLDAAACRLQEGVTAAAACRMSLDSLHRFNRAVPASQGWLAAEGAWVEIAVSIRQFSRATETKSPDAAAWLQQGLGRCESAEPLLPEAPVNGKEMMEDCLALAGWGRDLPRYFRFSDWLLSQSSGAATHKKLFEMAGEGCRNTPFKSKTSPPEPSAKADPWCAALGYTAARRWRPAVQIVVQQPEPPPADHPWADLEAYLRQQAAQEFVTYDTINSWYDPL